MLAVLHFSTVLYSCHADVEVQILRLVFKALPISRYSIA